MANSRWQTDQYYLYLASACAVDFSITRLVSMIFFFCNIQDAAAHRTGSATFLSLCEGFWEA